MTDGLGNWFSSRQLGMSDVRVDPTRAALTVLVIGLAGFFIRAVLIAVCALLAFAAYVLARPVW
jgi:hypothetical protein